MIYQWREGYFGSVKPEKAAKRLNAIRRKKGSLAPSYVVEDAEPVSSPLHSCFTWDNKRAAHEFRLWEARSLIGALVELEDGDAEGTPVRSFVSIAREDGESDYTPVALLKIEMAENQETREQMISRAVQDARSIQRAYGHLVPELSELFEAISRLEVLA